MGKGFSEVMPIRTPFSLAPTEGKYLSNLLGIIWFAEEWFIVCMFKTNTFTFYNLINRYLATRVRCGRQFPHLTTKTYNALQHLKDRFRPATTTAGTVGYLTTIQLILEQEAAFTKRVSTQDALAEFKHQQQSIAELKL